LLLAILFTSVGGCAPPEVDDTAGASGDEALEPASQPAYFGFYNSSTPGFPDEMLATSSFANTTWLSCLTAAECTARLAEAKYFNMHAMVAVPWPQGVAPTAPAGALEAAWAANWATYTSLFAPYVADGTIVAFYPWDEPFSQVYPDTAGAAVRTGELNFIASTIKKSFPTAKVALVFTASLTFSFLVHNVNIIPANFDWIGIDIYQCFASCTNNDTVNPANNFTQPYQWYVTELEKYLTPNQRVMLLPGTAIYYGNTYAVFETLPPSAWQPYVTGYTADVQGILNIAAHDPRVVGVFGFLFQSYYDNGIANPGFHVGANDPTMTTMMNALVSYGHSVVNRNYAQPADLSGTFVTGKPVQLVGLNAQKCLGPLNANVKTGTAIVQSDCLDATHLEQIWRLYQVSAGTFQIASENSISCLDLQNGSTANNTLVVQAICAAAGTRPSQLWNLIATPGGYRIQSAASGGCLDVVGASLTNGAAIQSSTCANTPAETYSLNAPVFAMSTAYSNSVLWAAANVVDENPLTVYSSPGFATNANSNGTFLAAWLAAPQIVKQIRLQARMVNGNALGFPTQYSVYRTASDNSSWVPVGTVSTQPDASGRAVIQLPAAVKTYGVMIVPKTLSADKYGNHYFQMADVQMLGNGLPE
jgi:hypothetical protein